MEGLEPGSMYKVTELHPIDRFPLSCEGKVFSGKYLMENGLVLPNSHSAKNPEFGSSWASRVLYLEAQ